MELIIKCEQIDDVAKEKYLRDRSAASAKRWPLRQYYEKQQMEDEQKEQLGQLELRLRRWSNCRGSRRTGGHARRY